MTPFLYQCSTCGKRYRRDEVRYLCPDCAQGLSPRHSAGRRARRPNSITPPSGSASRSRQPDWSLFSAVEDKHYPPYPFGQHAVLPGRGAGQRLGFENVWLKNDGLNPSASLKDRASFLVVAEANRLKEHAIVTASTGNAASALAAVCAAAGKQAIIFVPESAPKAKLVQMVLLRRSRHAGARHIR